MRRQQVVSSYWQQERRYSTDIPPNNIIILFSGVHGQIFNGVYPIVDHHPLDGSDFVRALPTQLGSTATNLNEHSLAL